MTVKTVLSKPVGVVWFRLVQLIKLKIHTKLKFWSKIELKIHQKIANTKNPWKEKSELFSRHFSTENIPEYLKVKMISGATEIMDGSISIFDQTYRFNMPLCWDTDWRVDHSWENNFYKTYRFYEEEKPKEYDVKFPWELSRLSFLIPVARAYQLEGKENQLKYLEEVLIDWKARNPVAYSVNWYPMEVSVRTINLIQVREILLLATNTDSVINILNEILLLHGIFLWRNIEFTDIRGNHYSANLTALLLLGNVFKRLYSEAYKWYNYALRKTENEFHLQFINDGVNFEKSLPYHRLVVEFYFISFLVMQRLGKNLSHETLTKFKKACEFVRDYTKPNYLTPIIGDNDSASVFQNDDVSLNEHTNILQLSSLFFEDESLNIKNVKYYSTLEVLGTGFKINNRKSRENTFQLHFYNLGGFVTIKDKQNYFIADVGEVGMKGRGGHGHNDLFSFELMLDNQEIIVDAGCYTYTGNLTLKTKMKSTACHNGLVVDGEEIAPMIGNWGISNMATPIDVKVETRDSGYVISGKHMGYNRLSDPVTHVRTFEIQEESFILKCIDTVNCKSEHEIHRNLHFSEDVSLKIKSTGVFVIRNGKNYIITADDSTEFKIEDYTLSYNYGSKIMSKKLILSSRIMGTSILHFNIEKLSTNE